jgi:tetratricopeptide (TPR) repeat protein
MLLESGKLSRRLSDWRAARVRLEAAVSLLRTLDDRAGLADALVQLGDALLRDGGTPGAARACREEALALRRALGDPAALAEALAQLGHHAMRRRDFEEADALLAEGVDLYRSLGDLQGAARALLTQGQVGQERGDPAAAAACHAESLALARALDDTGGVASALHHLAEVARLRDDFRGAVPLYEESLARFERLPASAWMTARTQQALAYALLGRGQPAGVSRAARMLRDSLRYFADRRYLRLVAVGLAGLGDVAAREGRWERAALLGGAADALCRTAGESLPAADQRAFERGLAVARARLPAPQAAAFAAAWSAGRAAPWERAVAEALAAAPGA